MYLHCLGISHNTANTHLREILAFTPARIECELTQFSNGDIVLEKPIQEIVILSTCNRVEIYAAASEPAFEASCFKINFYIVIFCGKFYAV